MMELEPEEQKKSKDEGNEIGCEKEGQQGDGGSCSQTVLAGDEVFTSVKSINISGSNPDLRRLISEDTISEDTQDTVKEACVGIIDKANTNSGNFSIPDIKSETRVLVPRVCSDSHIGEGEGFHSSRLSSSASHSSLTSVLVAIGITSSRSNSKDHLFDQPTPVDDKKECEGKSVTKNEITDQKDIVKIDIEEPSEKEEKVVENPKIETEDIDVDISILADHDTSVANTDDLLDEEELLDEYDEPDDELHRELEKIFDSDLLVGSSGSGGSPKASKYREIATWTQEDDMPSPLSDLSPIQSPRKSGRSNRSGILGNTTSGGHQSQFDHQYQYHQQQHQYYSGESQNPEHRHHHHHHHHHSGSRNNRSHHTRNSRGIHQSQSNQRGTGNSSVGEFIHHQPQQHHQPTECFTVSSQLLSREARLYENVPTTQGELESLEILLAGENCNYPTSGGSGGAGNTTPSTSNASQTNRSSINSNKNNGHSSSGSNNNLLLHHHHHSANNLNLVPSSGNSAEQLFSVSELLGPGSCLAVGGGPPSRTSWVDSGRESLSFDGENNNSGGSSRNLLLIPPPPPPPINYQGFVGSNNIMMQKHQHHQSSQSPSHSYAHSSRKSGSRRDRLVRQKQAIDETFLPIPTNSDKLGIDQGGTGGGYLAVPSPRRGVISGNIIASNFTTAVASPISLQRHPPASQIMLQENKKNRPLIPCDSPYGIMSGGLGTGTGDWTFASDKKGSQLTRDLLRCRSPQRGRSKGGKGHNQSFDYGELPSHQMFPKRHLLTSRQLSSHNSQAYPSIGVGGIGNGNGGNGNNPNGNNNPNPPYLVQPNQNHRSFPAGLLSGLTPKSCSMGDLTASTASPGNHNSSHLNYQSYHGKNPDQIALCSNTNPSMGLQSSTVPLVTSLPMPPSTSVTYEFSLAPQSGTLAPGWHLTAVQRGLATAVPLAAAVARRRVPRPRTARPRFGFTDKNEARRAKWTIAITALALLAMSMLLVGITLRLAPLIDDLGSSSTSSSLSPAKIHMAADPYARRASGTGCSSYIRSSPYPIRSNNPNSSSSSGKDYYTQSPSNSLKFDSTRVRRSHGDIDIRRQLSATLNIPSRQDSVKSCSSKSTSGQQSPIMIAPFTSIQPIHYTSSSHMSRNQQKHNNNNVPGHHIYRLSQGQASSAARSHSPSVRGSRSNSITPSSVGLPCGPHHPITDLAKTEKRHRKYVIMGFTFLLLVAIFCVVMSLSISSHIDARVRKENENLMRVIQQTTSTSNNSAMNQSSSSTLPPLPPIGIEDQDENNNNYNSNSNSMSNNNNANPGQSLTRSVITVDPGQEETERIVKSSSKEAPDVDVDVDRGGGDDDESRPLSSSLIGAVLLKNLNYDSPGSKSNIDADVNLGKDTAQQHHQQQAKSSPTEFKSENSNILLEEISDIDEVDRVRTSIVLR